MHFLEFIVLLIQLLVKARNFLIVEFSPCVELKFVVVLLSVDHVYFVLHLGKVLIWRTTALW